MRVINNATGCFTDHTSFNVVVNPIPIANFVDDLEICDENSDGSARNGFSQSIDLNSQTAGILGTQDPNTHTVTYHRSLAEARNGDQATEVLESFISKVTEQVNTEIDTETDKKRSNPKVELLKMQLERDGIRKQS